jgi:hypothetical protein
LIISYLQNTSWTWITLTGITILGFLAMGLYFGGMASGYVRLITEDWKHEHRKMTMLFATIGSIAFFIGVGYLMHSMIGSQWSWTVSDLSSFTSHYQLKSALVASQREAFYALLFLCYGLGSIAGVGVSSWMLRDQTQTSSTNNVPAAALSLA